MDTGTVIVILAFLATVSGVVAFGRDTNTAVQRVRAKPLSWYLAHGKYLGKTLGAILVSGIGGFFAYGFLTLTLSIVRDDESYDDTGAIVLLLALCALASVGSGFVRKYLQASREHLFWLGFLLGSALGIYTGIYLY